MSMYRYRDPGTDPDYCDGLSADSHADRDADLDAMRSAVARLLYPDTTHALDMPTVTDESKIAALKTSVAELQQAIVEMAHPF